MKSPLQIILLTIALTMPLPLFAEGTAQQSTSLNPVLIGLVSIIIVLMAAMAALAFVYKQLAFAYRDKMRKERSSGPVVKTIALLLATSSLSIKSFAQDVASKTAEASSELAANATTLIGGISSTDFYALVTIIGFELLFIAIFVSMIYRMVRILRDIPERQPLMSRLFKRNLLDYFNKSVSVEKEESIVLDHDYDGIRELDNSLPPWWKWGFVMTIVFAFTYMWYFHVNDGPNQIDEYNFAVVKAEEEKAAYLAKAGNAIDENTVKLITEAAELADAGVLFKNTCAACHREDGGGNVGPNLTDAYWLHGGSLKDVFKSVKYGWKDKGMPEWQHNMSAKQIAVLTSYIMNMKGKKVDGGKAPQGDLYVEQSGNSTDSAAAKQPEPSTASVGAETKQLAAITTN
jgi:cytochrome c oxidase cbb3-type subunit III